jgi:hypothetical protein
MKNVVMKMNRKVLIINTNGKIDLNKKAHQIEAINKSSISIILFMEIKGAHIIKVLMVVQAYKLDNR